MDLYLNDLEIASLEDGGIYTFGKVSLTPETTSSTIMSNVSAAKIKLPQVGS